MVWESLTSRYPGVSCWRNKVAAIASGAKLVGVGWRVGSTIRAFYRNLVILGVAGDCVGFVVVVVAAGGGQPASFLQHGSVTQGSAQFFRTFFTGIRHPNITMNLSRWMCKHICDMIYCINILFTHIWSCNITIWNTAIAPMCCIQSRPVL